VDTQTHVLVPAPRKWLTCRLGGSMERCISGMGLRRQEKPSSRTSEEYSLHFEQFPFHRFARKHLPAFSTKRFCFASTPRAPTVCSAPERQGSAWQCLRGMWFAAVPSYASQLQLSSPPCNLSCSPSGMPFPSRNQLSPQCHYGHAFAFI